MHGDSDGNSLPLSGHHDRLITGWLPVGQHPQNSSPDRIDAFGGEHFKEILIANLLLGVTDQLLKGFAKRT